MADIELLKKRQALNYILSKIFGNALSQEELDAITGKPEPQVQIPRPAPDTRFKALKEKLAQNEPEVADVETRQQQ